MVADVQSWLDNPATNFGWLVLGDESTGTTAKRFDSRESTSPPVLTIEYTEPSAITLSATGRKVGGINTVRLSWSGATSGQVDVYRDGVVIVTTPNDGSYVDSTGDTGRARYTYKVCEAGTQTCSAVVTVRFRQ
jgi:serine protease